jgi:hypothetical protein
MSQHLFCIKLYQIVLNCIRILTSKQLNDIIELSKKMDKAYSRRGVGGRSIFVQYKRTVARPGCRA